MPGRPRRLRSTTERMLRRARRAGRRLPRGQPRSRSARDRSTSRSSRATPAGPRPGHARCWSRSGRSSSTAWSREGSTHGVALYHGSARDPIWEYVLSDDVALATLELTDSPLVLVGHSHVALQVVQSGDELDRRRSAGRNGARARRCAGAAQPRLGRTTARRRPSSRLPPVGSRRAPRELPARRVRRRANATRDAGGRPTGDARRAACARLVAVRRLAGRAVRARALARAAGWEPEPRRPSRRPLAPHAPRRPRSPRARARAGRLRAPSRSAT